MRDELPKVLMLGWEFPPIINGGLGVACHDLSSAMSDLVNITMVVPKTSPRFKMKNLNLVGVNNIDPSELARYPADYNKPLPFRLESVEADIDPYYSEQAGAARYGGIFREERAGDSPLPGRFNIDSLYGGDVISKVRHFADITAGMASRMDFDIIHAHDWMTMLAGARIKQQTGKPLVVHLHSLEVDRSGPESRGWVYDLEKKGMEYADLLMPVSQFTAKNICEHYGIDSSKLFVVHNGSRPVQPFRSKRCYKEKTVLFVGRLTRQKGPEKFLEIAARVLQRDPDVRFVMAGVGDYFRSVLEQSAYKQLGNRFHLTGFLDANKLNYLFSISDVYCMPSVSEPFGLSAVEAAHFGIPCVISKQSGVAEVLSGALKFDFWDVDRAAGSILSLLRDRVLRDKVVRDASDNLRSITWDRSARRVVDGYASKKFI